MPVRIQQKQDSILCDSHVRRSDESCTTRMWSNSKALPNLVCRFYGVSQDRVSPEQHCLMRLFTTVVLKM